MKPFQVKSHLWVFVNALVENPAFDSQARPAARGPACLSPQALTRRPAADQGDADDQGEQLRLQVRDLGGVHEEGAPRFRCAASQRGCSGVR